MCRRALVSGTVQGVGYRAFARRAALELDVRGYAATSPTAASRCWPAARPRRWTPS